MEGTAVMRKRSNRSDQGQVRETPRDAHALMWLSQMYGAPVDVVAQLLGSSVAATRKTVARWVNAGWATRARPVAGLEWICPTGPTAKRMLGWDVGPWVPSPTKARHTRLLCELRLSLAGANLENWVSERELAHRAHGYKKAGEKLPHTADALWMRGGLDQSDNVLIELELHTKHPARLVSIMNDLLQLAHKQGAQEVRYVCGSTEVQNLVTRSRDQLRAQTNDDWMKRLTVQPLSDVVKESP